MCIRDRLIGGDLNQGSPMNPNMTLYADGRGEFSGGVNVTGGAGSADIGYSSGNSQLYVNKILRSEKGIYVYRNESDNINPSLRIYGNIYTNTSDVDDTNASTGYANARSDLRLNEITTANHVSHFLASSSSGGSALPGTVTNLYGFHNNGTRHGVNNYGFYSDSVSSLVSGGRGYGFYASVGLSLIHISEPTRPY